VHISYLDQFNREFVLRVGFQVVNHTIEISGVVIFVSGITAVMVGCITHHVISIIGDILKINILAIDISV